eukprot:scaffold175027_cov37-Tisochrysis_lutea.AAC.1
MRRGRTRTHTHTAQYSVRGINQDCICMLEELHVDAQHAMCMHPPHPRDACRSAYFNLWGTFHKTMRDAG